jgi:hypothetical protein
MQQHRQKCLTRCLIPEPRKGLQLLLQESIVRAFGHGFYQHTRSFEPHERPVAFAYDYSDPLRSTV